MTLRDRAFAWSGRHLPAMHPDAWMRWTSGAAELARDARGRRTLRTADGAHVVKESGLNSLLSSALLHPYALRFATNASSLLALGIAAPEVVGAWRRTDAPLHVVIYAWREGRELRDAVSAASIEALGRLVARMHDAGIVFRSAHLGNFLVQPSGELAIIDCVDVRFLGRPLSPAERSADLVRMLHLRPEDRAAFTAHVRDLCVGYFASARLSPGDRLETWTRLPGEVTKTGLFGVS
jgi:hypothetical protein